MSLKAFHILFIGLSALLSFGFGLWCVSAFALEGGALYLGTGLLSFVAGIGLIFYGIRFLHKLRHIGYL